MRFNKVLIATVVSTLVVTPAVARPGAGVIEAARAAAARAQQVAQQARATSNDARAQAASGYAREIRSVLQQDMPAIRDARGDAEAVRAAVQTLRSNLRDIPRPGRGN